MSHDICEFADLDECLISAHEVANRAQLKNWSISFQSQFGPEQWLEPATDDVLLALAEQKKKVLLTAIGFSADCLETIEELDESYKELYESYGGPEYDRVPCLNASEASLELVKTFI